MSIISFGEPQNPITINNLVLSWVSWKVQYFHQKSVCLQIQSRIKKDADHDVHEHLPLEDGKIVGSTGDVYIDQRMKPINGNDHSMKWERCPGAFPFEPWQGVVIVALPRTNKVKSFVLLLVVITCYIDAAFFALVVSILSSIQQLLAIERRHCLLCY